MTTAVSNTAKPKFGQRPRGRNEAVSGTGWGEPHEPYGSRGKEGPEKCSTFGTRGPATAVGSPPFGGSPTDTINAHSPGTLLLRRDLVGPTKILAHPMGPRPHHVIPLPRVRLCTLRPSDVALPRARTVQDLRGRAPTRLLRTCVIHLRDLLHHLRGGLPTRTRPRIGISAVQDRIPRRHRRRHHARRHHPQPQPLPGTAPGLHPRAVRLLAPRLLAHLRGHRHLPAVLRRPIVVGVAPRPALPAHRRPVHHRQRTRGGIFRRAPHQDHQPGAGCCLLDLDTFVCGWGVGRVRGSLVVAGEDASALTQETATGFN